MDVDEDAGDGSGDGEMDNDDENLDEGEDVDETTVMLSGESSLESTLQSSQIMSLYQADLGRISFPSHRIQGTLLAHLLHYRVQSVTRTTSRTSEALVHTVLLVLCSWRIASIFGPQTPHLICAPTPALRQTEMKKGAELTSAVGSIVGSHVRVRSFSLLFIFFSFTCTNQEVIPITIIDFLDAPN